MFRKITSGFARRASLIFTVATVLILAVATSLSAYAWYSKNLELKNRGMQFDLKADDAVASYTVYQYDLANNRGTTTNASGTDLKISNIDFNQYDLIFTKRNRFTPIFAHIVITKIESMPESGKIILTLSNESNTSDSEKLDHLPGSAKDETSYISDIIRFTAMVDHGYEITGEQSKDPSEFYDYVDKALYEKTLTYTGTEHHNEDANHTEASGSFFTAIPSSGTGIYTRTQTVSLKLNYFADDWDVVNGERVLNLYLYMTYDTGMIDCLTNERNMNVISIGQNVIDFANDLGSLTIRCEPAA